MGKVVVHIGAHKTGTSYIQGRLHQNRAFLEEKGIYYPFLGPNNAHHVLTSKWIPDPVFDDTLAKHGGIDALWADVIAQHVDKKGTLILSAEPFSRLQPAHVNFAELASMLSGFEDAKIVYYARSPLDLLQSIWLEVSKNYETPSLKPFLQHAMKAGLATGVPVDHNLVLDMVGEGFAPEQVKVLDYETTCRAPGGVLQVLLDLCDADVDVDRDLTELQAQGSNFSPDPISQYLATIITDRRAPERPLYNAVKGVVDRYRAGAKTGLIAGGMHKLLVDAFEPKVQAFEKRVAETQPGFKLSGPKVPKEKQFTQDQLSQALAIEVARAVYQSEN